MNEEDLEQVKETLQKEFIRQNTAKINVDRAMQQKNESEEVFSSLMKERQQMDRQVEEIRADQTGIKEELEHSRQRETEIQHANEAFQKMLEEQKELENKAESELSGIQLEEANIRQKVEFAQTNVERINGDLEKFETEKTELLENAKNFKEDVEKKQHDIAEIQKTILASSDSHGELEQKLRERVEQKEQMSAEYRGFFLKQEEISERCNGLDKEVFRLNNQREKLNESAEQQTNYLWEEYELTPHAAAELRNSEYEDPLALKKLIAAVKDEIRKLGTVNVNAIEEYKEVSERYTFLKGQHDDLVEAEQTLLGIIEDLDSGMRKQFMEKFAEIQKEFNASFKHLFGGGHGALELVEDEDILECGIRIIAQPPGKKLQNMMQMSGGEKALTAIALLFAIQALKPSPFCLLDEHIKQHVVKTHAGKNPVVKNGVLRNRQLFAFGLKGAQHFDPDFLIAILAFSHKTMPSFVIGSNQINLRAVSPPSPQSRHRKRQLPGKAQLCQVLTTDLLKRFRCEIRKTRLYGRFPF